MSGTAPSQGNRVLEHGFWKYGRFYGSWQNGHYLFPIDMEELNRLDIFHKFFLVARNDILHDATFSPDRKPRVMDLGTGTGIWAFHIAERMQEQGIEGEVLAVDINRIQPQMIPRGVRTQVQDLEQPRWPQLMSDCDLIHVRLMLGSIRTDAWPNIYKQIFQHLSPRGSQLEHIEVDWTPQWDGEDRPPHSALKEWSDLFLRGMDEFQRSARVDPASTQKALEEAGFTKTQLQTIKCFVNPWHVDKDVRETARWLNLGFTTGIEAMSLMPLIEKMGLNLEQVQELCQRVKKEACILKYHAYFTAHIWTARRP